MRNPVAARCSSLGAVVALLASLVSISCGDAMLRTHTAGASGTLAANTSSLNFGNVSVGASKTSSVTLTNSAPMGGANVTFSQVKASGAGFSATTSALPIVLSPGQSLNVTIIFAPKAAGAATGSLSITEDGTSDPSMVSLTGMGLGAGQLAVSPSTLAFGNVTVGSSSQKTGTLTAGSSDVKVSSAGWSGQGYSVSSITFPVTIAAGTSVSFSVTFAPQGAGNSPGSISFVSNASNSPTNELFSGAGTQAQSSGSSASAHRVDLAWDPSASAVAGYYVYRGTGGNFSRLNSSPQTTTAYTDETVNSGATYFYVTTAVDANGTESAQSNQVSATVPSP